MKVEYRTAGTGGAYTTLYDDSIGQVSETYNLSFTDKAEETPGFGAGSIGVTPNGNTMATVEIPLAIVYGSGGAAKAGVRALRATLKGLRVNLKVTIDADVDYYPSAVLKTMTAKISGRAVDYMFNFTAQDVQLAEPA